MEEKHITGDAAFLIQRYPDLPVFTAPRQVLEQITGYKLTRGVLCALKRKEPCTPEEVLKNEKYEVIYACGPTPMLAYVKQIAESAGIECWLSMEARMACGVGVCLGCTIDTTEGKKRCCKEGPVFDSKILPFEKPADTVAGIKVQPRREPLNFAPDLSVEIAGVKFQNPVIGSSVIMPSFCIHFMASTMAMNEPVMEAVRVPPSA